MGYYVSISMNRVVDHYAVFGLTMRTPGHDMVDVFQQVSFVVILGVCFSFKYACSL